MNAGETGKLQTILFLSSFNASVDCVGVGGVVWPQRPPVLMTWGWCLQWGVIFTFLLLRLGANFVFLSVLTDFWT